MYLNLHTDGFHTGMNDAIKTAEITLKAAYDKGFSWEENKHALDKVFEEIAELKKAYKSGVRVDIIDELGDSLYALISFALVLDISPIEALISADEKFKTRFQAMENLSEKPLNDLSKSEWRALWQTAKKATS